MLIAAEPAGFHNHLIFNRGLSPDQHLPKSYTVIFQVELEPAFAVPSGARQGFATSLFLFNFTIEIVLQDDLSALWGGRES